jgi:ribosomal protein L37AE/L43A
MSDSTNRADDRAPADEAARRVGDAGLIPDERQSPSAERLATAELVCDRCGAPNLVRVKGCWYCERCHYKFDCYGW